MRKVEWLHDLMQDLRYGVRILMKSRGFTLVAVLTLALGSGAAVAVFSVVNAVVLRPLPYEDPDQLVMLWQKTPQQDLPASYLNFEDWRSQNQVFESMAAFRYDVFNLTGAGEPERLEGMTVSGNFLSTLGVKPADPMVALRHE
jgi:putative ABC transport system permease protein